MNLLLTPFSMRFSLSLGNGNFFARLPLLTLSASEDCPAPLSTISEQPQSAGLLGVLVIVFGVANGSMRFISSERRAVHGANVDDVRKHLCHVLDCHLLLRLEFLIAADIIDTPTKPGMEDLTGLRVIVLICAVISYLLRAELKADSKPKTA